MVSGTSSPSKPHHKCEHVSGKGLHGISEQQRQRFLVRDTGLINNNTTTTTRVGTHAARTCMPLPILIFAVNPVTCDTPVSRPLETCRGTNIRGQQQSACRARGVYSSSRRERTRTHISGSLREFSVCKHMVPPTLYNTPTRKTGQIFSRTADACREPAVVHRSRRARRETRSSQIGGDCSSCVCVFSSCPPFRRMFAV